MPSTAPYRLDEDGFKRIDTQDTVQNADTADPDLETAILDDIARVTTTLGHAPTLTEYLQHGDYHDAALQAVHADTGTWRDLLYHAGAHAATAPTT